MTVPRPPIESPPPIEITAIVTPSTSAPRVAARAPLPASDTTAALEAIETRAWVDLFEAAPEAIKRAARLSLDRTDGLVVAAAAVSPRPSTSRRRSPPSSPRRSDGRGGGTSGWRP